MSLDFVALTDTLDKYIEFEAEISTGYREGDPDAVKTEKKKRFFF